MTNAVVFDLEFTAWPGSMEHRWLRPGEFREIVQIGAVKLDAATFAHVGEFNMLVKPRLNPVLSSYFENLTGVTNAALAGHGHDLGDACRAFLAFVDGAPLMSFGRDDRVVRDNLRLYGIVDMPPLPDCTNIAQWLAEQGIDPRGLHACDIAHAVGAEFFGRQHDALDYARSVALGIRTLIAQGARNPLMGRSV